MPPATPSRGRATPERPCLNCGDPTPGLFCGTCGQRKVDMQVSTWRMLREALDDQLSLNSALPRTLAALFLAPGKLTQEYVRGRIVRYIPPFRLYLVASILYILAVSLAPGGTVLDLGDGATGEAVQVRAQGERAPVVLTLEGEAPAAAAGEAGATAAEAGATAAEAGAQSADSAATEAWIPLAVEAEDNALVRFLKRRILRLNAMDREQALTAINERFMAHFSTALFFLVPGFAVLLKLLYLGSRRYFVEHFVFALHLHAAIFFVLAVATPIAAASGSRGGAPVEALTPLFLLYAVLALRRVYGQGVIFTTLKALLLFVLHLIVLGVVVVGLLLFSILLL